MSKTYTEKLKDPRWQKRRLFILNRDKFTCRSCECDNKTLNVHHINYSPDYNDPWDYKDKELITLCDECHTAWHHIYDNISCDIASLVVNLYDKLFWDDVLEFEEKQNKNGDI